MTAKPRARRRKQCSWAAWIDPAFRLLRQIEKPEHAPPHWEKTDEPTRLPSWIPCGWRDWRCFPKYGTAEAVREWFACQITLFGAWEEVAPGTIALADHHPDIAEWCNDTMHNALLLVEYALDVLRLKVGLSLNDAQRISKTQRPHIALRTIQGGLFNAAGQQPAMTGDRSQSEGGAKLSKPNSHADKGRWLTVTDAAMVADVNRGTITHAADGKKLKSNGKTGRQRRIDAIDLTRWIRERSGKPDQRETDAAVRQKLEKAGNNDH